MKEYGLLRLDIVLKTSFLTRMDIHIEDDLTLLQDYCDGIYKNAFDYGQRVKLNAIEDMDVSSDAIYIIEYRMMKNNFFVQYYKDYVLISFSLYPGAEVFLPLMPVLKKYILLSDFVLIGFETTLFIDRYPDNVETVLSDKSLYPIYASKGEKVPVFERYSHSSDIMGKIIEQFISFILSTKDIVYMDSSSI